MTNIDNSFNINAIQQASIDTYEFVTGPAGSGKTYSVRQRPNSLLTATTGIAAVNLGAGCRTLNSLLGFYDVRSLRENMAKGTVQRAFFRLRKLYPYVKEIVTDEASMLSGPLLDLLFPLFESSGGYRWTLVGDFAQLPPVPDKGFKNQWAFESPRFKQFKQTKLTKIWRQDDPLFLSALNAARLGDGQTAVETFGSRLSYSPRLDPDESACVIMAKNLSVDDWNRRKLASLPGEAINLHNVTWGKPASDWKSVPPTLTLKVGARVMCLSNNYDAGYVNGSLGTIVSISPLMVGVRLDGEDGDLVTVKPVVDYNKCEKDTKWKVYSADGRSVLHSGDCQEGYDEKNRETFYYQGKLTRWPLRLAYATTCHKSQGLTLDSVVISLLDHKGEVDEFFRSPNMAYVALSRCRTLQGMKIIGQPFQLQQAIRVDETVRKAGLL